MALRSSGVSQKAAPGHIEAESKVSQKDKVIVEASLADSVVDQVQLKKDIDKAAAMIDDAVQELAQDEHKEEVVQPVKKLYYRSHFGADIQR